MIENRIIGIIKACQLRHQILKDEELIREKMMVPQFAEDEMAPEDDDYAGNHSRLPHIWTEYLVGSAHRTSCQENDGSYGTGDKDHPQIVGIQATGGLSEN